MWACEFEQDSQAWSDLRPYTSRDLDYFGGLADARRAKELLRAGGRLNTKMEPGPNAGVLTLRMSDGRELIIDILTGVYGLSAAELTRTAVRLTGSGPLSGVGLRVMHPLLLLEGKAASLRGLDQTHRQDAKHLRMMILVLREWLRDRLTEPRAVFTAVERLAACAASPDGVQAYAMGIDMLQTLPLEEMEQAEGYDEFLKQRYPQITDRITRKRSSHLDALRNG